MRKGRSTQLRRLRIPVQVLSGSSRGKNNSRPEDDKLIAPTKPNSKLNSNGPSVVFEYDLEEIAAEDRPGKVEEIVESYRTELEDFRFFNEPLDIEVFYTDQPVVEPDEPGEKGGEDKENETEKDKAKRRGGKQSQGKEKEKASAGLEKDKDKDRPEVKRTWKLGQPPSETPPIFPRVGPHRQALRMALQVPRLA